ncbi:MAG: hypothetical protein SGARI_001328 [Bacillariaceae sp.]
MDESGHLFATSARVGAASPRLNTPKNMHMHKAALDCKHELCPDELIFSQGQSENNMIENGDVDIELRRQRRLRKLSAGGTLNNLVVLMRFNDHRNRDLPSQDDMDLLFNGSEQECSNRQDVCRESGSVQSYFQRFSHGKLTIKSHVTPWIDVPYSEADAADGKWGTTDKLHEVIKAALDKADQTIDFNMFDQKDNDDWIDAITIVHSGYAAEHNTGYMNRIWSHKWRFMSGPWTSKEGVQVHDYNINPGLWGTSGNQIGRIGVICHELGHFLGIWDLYDTDQTGNGKGLGWHGLMANSWGFDWSQLYPPHLSAWSMLQLGFSEGDTPTQGTNSILRADLTPTGDQVSVYKIGDGQYGFPKGEYLAIQYSKFMKYSSSTLEGILIYHIDENADYNTEGYPGRAGKRPQCW